MRILILCLWFGIPELYFEITVELFEGGLYSNVGLNSIATIDFLH